MKGLRLVGRGLSDTFENLVPFTLASLTWWASVLLIVPAPGGLVALFRYCDPRHGVESDRPTLGESFRFAWQSLGRGWALMAITLPVLGLLVYNLGYYGDSDSFLRLLTPLWVFLLLIAVIVALTAFSLVAVLEKPVLPAFRLGLLMAAAHLPSVLVIAIVLGAIVAVGTILIVPLIMFLPCTVAATFNRFVLTNLRIPIADPLAPTEERRQEEAKTASSRRWRFGP